MIKSLIKVSISLNRQLAAAVALFLAVLLAAPQASAQFGMSDTWHNPNSISSRGRGSSGFKNDQNPRNRTSGGKSSSSGGQRSYRSVPTPPKKVSSTDLPSHYAREQIDAKLMTGGRVRSVIGRAAPTKEAPKGQVIRITSTPDKSRPSGYSYQAEGLDGLKDDTPINVRYTFAEKGGRQLTIGDMRVNAGMLRGFDQGMNALPDFSRDHAANTRKLLEAAPLAGSIPVTGTKSFQAKMDGVMAMGTELAPVYANLLKQSDVKGIYGDKKLGLASARHGVVEGKKIFGSTRMYDGKINITSDLFETLQGVYGRGPDAQFLIQAEAFSILVHEGAGHIRDFNTDIKLIRGPAGPERTAVDRLWNDPTKIGRARWRNTLEVSAFIRQLGSVSAMERASGRDLTQLKNRVLTNLIRYNNKLKELN